MGAIDFRTVDLNLLAPLRVLLVERHVTRSAEKLGISQPAMSASLARSRTLFRDQLLVRGAKGLVLTPRAEQLLEQLDHVMAVIGRDGGNAQLASNSKLVGKNLVFLREPLVLHFNEEVPRAEDVIEGRRRLF